MGFDFRPISAMPFDLAYNKARDQGLLPDARQYVPAKIEELRQEQNRVVAEVDQLAKDGITELSSMGTELKTCVLSPVAENNTTYVAESVEDLHEVNNNGQQNLDRVEQHLHDLVEKTQMIRIKTQEFQREWVKQAAEDRLFSFMQGAGNQAAHHIATREKNN